VSYNLRLLISCPDKKGLIAAISSFISMHDGNILSADQYVSDSGTFFMRLEIEGEGFGLSREEFAGALAPLARRHGMNWRVSFTDTPKRMAILVSRYDHCLMDLLWRWDAGELKAQIPLVVSNHLTSPPGWRPMASGSTICLTRRRARRSRSPGS
jgi:formyltetrahydrofolate deformylase